MTGDESFILKVKSANTGSLEKLLGEIRSVEGVTRTVTKVVLSTAKESQALELDAGLAENSSAKKRNSATQMARSKSIVSRISIALRHGSEGQ